MTNPQLESVGYYTTADVARLAGLTPHRVARWARMGIIRHSVSSEPNIYSYADVGEAILAHYLADHGKRAGEIGELVERLRDEYGEWPLAIAPLKHDGALCAFWDEERKVHVSADIPGHDLIKGTLFNLKEIRKALGRGGWVSLKNPRLHIEIDPERHSGEPVVKGRRLSTQRVASLAAEPEGRTELEEDFQLSGAEIDDAVGYERDIAELVAA
jgi:uncharacterized protein (DUF433 family)/DNA-binding transcriptional MerR regulator